MPTGIYTITGEGTDISNASDQFHYDYASVTGNLTVARASLRLNELLMKLTTRHDPLPVLFDTYHETLDSLRNGAPLERELRVFEKRLLEALGYGLDLGAEAVTGKPIEADEYYHFRPEQGLVPSVADATGSLAGHSLIGLANEQLSSARELEDSRRLLQVALAQCLEGRPLATRGVARAVARRELHTRPRT